MIENLKIFQKTYDFVFWVKQVVPKFAKAHKYSLGIQLENEVLELLKFIVRANMSRTKKADLIKECLLKHEMVKVFLRLCKDFKLISIKQYEFATRKLVEIGRMLGAWLNKFEK